MHFTKRTQFSCRLSTFISTLRSGPPASWLAVRLRLPLNLTRYRKPAARSGAQVARACSWLLGSSIVLLSVVPAELRPVTAAHGVEHSAIFLLLGLAVVIGYPGRYRLSTIAVLIFTAAVELVQLIAPGRHARLFDFVVDALGAMVGLCLAGILQVALDRKGRAS